MNELTELDNAGSPEPGLRLRKGHMSDSATTQTAFEEDSSEQRLLLEINEFLCECFIQWLK